VENYITGEVIICRNSMLWEWQQWEWKCLHSSSSLSVQKIVPTQPGDLFI